MLVRRPTLVVAALVIREGRILLDRRKPGGTLGGLWEFPGGKVEPGETHAVALRRELHEELGVDANIGAEVRRLQFAYPDFDLELVLLRADVTGEPRPLEVDKVGWFTVAELGELSMPPADLPLLADVRSIVEAEVGSKSPHYRDETKTGTGD
ncbi:MAG: (deoxy)nucleoside triphosphate pyrophosphohydrolase [Deltaproteobacteria bacterium]|nr:(deoxy)nucleoside triphosphate pyrophosphohydrolase [Deltaproteobacteria bacterium]